MRKLLRICIVFSSFLFLSATNSFSAPHSKVKIENSLNACIKIFPEEFETRETLLLLRTKWQNVKNIGECGCKSAAIAYNVTESKTGMIVTSGVISSLGKEGYKFVINPDNSIFKNSKFILTANCA